MALLAGQSVGLVREIRPAADILRETVTRAEHVIRELSAQCVKPSEVGTVSNLPTLQELVCKSFDISKAFLDKFLALATRRRRSQG